MSVIQKLFLLAATVNLAWQLRSLTMGRASTGWKTTRGKILKCDVREAAFSLTAGDGDDVEQDDTYTANILYTYRVGAREFRSRRLTYQPTRGLCFAGAIDALNGLWAGRDVDVFYDPVHPSRAVIVPGASRDNAVRSALAALLFLYALWALV